MKLKIFLAIAILCSMSSAVMADLAPPAGFKKITLRLVVETAEDLADYRFFMKSGAAVEELVLKEGEQTSQGPLGGGARYSGGVLIAIPKAAIEDLSDAPRDGALSELKQAVYGGSVPGAIELVKHSFFRQVREKEAAGWKDPVYRIEKDEAKGLKAVWVSGGANESKQDDPAASTYYSTEPKSGAFWSAVVGTSLFTLAAVLGAAFFVRRMRMREQRLI